MTLCSARLRPHIPVMKHAAALATVALLATPLAAEEEAQSGRSLIEEGARLFMQGILQEMEPALDEMQGMAEEIEPAMRDFFASMGPALRDLLSEVEDWSVYQPPEMLPNGDIILRRKVPLEAEPDQPDEIEL